MHSFAWWPTLVVLVVASFTDLRSHRIPNWLVLPFLAAGIVVSGWRGGWHGLVLSFAGLGVALLIFGFLFWLGGMGAGDVKLCAAIGAWIGPQQMLWALFFTSLAGGIAALCWAAMGGFMKELFAGTGDLVFGWMRGGTSGAPETASTGSLKRKMPYAPAIAIGTLISFFAR
ncbi:MAG: A24 family peptidase [Terracidiphilus sp.]